MNKFYMNGKLIHKASDHNTKRCEVEKWVFLPHSDFERLKSNPYQEHEAITDARDLMYEDKNAYHCIMLLDEYGDDGLLIEAEGFDYPRLSMFVPDAALIYERYKTSEAELKLHDMIKDKIGVNFYLDLSVIPQEQKEASYVEFIVNGKTMTDLFDPDFHDNTGELYGFTCYVTSIKMADTITAIYHFGDSQLVTTSSVKDYITKAETYYDRFDEETIALIKAMADFGHYIQPMLATANHWEIGKDHAEMEKYYTDSFPYEAVKESIDSHKRSINLDTSDIESITYYLSLNEDTTLNILVKPNNDYNGTVTISTVLDGTDKSYEAIKLTDGRYKVSIPNIPAHKLGTSGTISIQTESGNASCTLSAMSYVYAVLNSIEQDEVSQNAMLSFYSYYDAAIKYLAKH